MKKYEVYRNIRQQALLFGLPVSLFAIQLIALVGSLLTIIFSFGFVLILAVGIGNTVLYLILIRMVHHPLAFTFTSVFPQRISAKQSTNLSYEAH